MLLTILKIINLTKTKQQDSRVLNGQLLDLSLYKIFVVKFRLARVNEEHLYLNSLELDIGVNRSSSDVPLQFSLQAARCKGKLKLNLGESH